MRALAKFRRIAIPRGLLLPAALAFAVLWLGVLGVALAARHSQTLLALGGASVVLTIALAVLMAERHMRLRGLVTTDALTGLVNHRGFHEVLTMELRHARRTGERVALVSLDLDDFKSLNDNHGHQYGDEVLRAVGRKLRGAVRASDTAARVGGEEFALILPGSGDDVALAVAERARAAVATVSIHGGELACSAGIAVYPDDAEQASGLCQLADAALYAAKRAGKRRTRRYNSDEVALSWGDDSAGEVETLLAAPHPIRSVFQPIVALATGQIVGYEALARFATETRRDPEVWFAQAHECGLGAELEAAAIRAALEPIGRPVGTLLSVNVSPSALFSDKVQASLPADLTDLVIELTEHEFVADDRTLAGVLAELRNRGALIAIDDAGAGYAGLRQVMRVRPDIVKLDRELITGIHTDAARMALVESLVRFARRTGASVCAEGIESLDDVAALSDLDVEWGQGLALAAPEPPWTNVSPVAAGVCRAALSHALRGATASDDPRISAGDSGLEQVSARLAGARSREDLAIALDSIATELHADKICLSRLQSGDGAVETLAENGNGSGETLFQVDEFPLTAHVLESREAAQVLVGDPASDPQEVSLLLALGHGSLLMVPVLQRGESLGILEAYSNRERPWTRAEISRARIVANQLAPVIERSAKPVS
jgi:diguanylate cyclase (GGDEF)-like protein